MSRLPFLFIITGMVGFLTFHITSLLSLSEWISEYMRASTGWFQAHLLVLGWGTMLAMGAVYQLINVILQAKIYSERLGYVHYVIFTIGLVGLLYGFITGQVYWIATFATLAFIGFLLFGWNMAVTLFRAAQWNTITISAGAAVLYLLLTGVTGLLMGLNFALGLWNELHQNLFGAHIWLGAVGWFGLLITGFSYKLFPMFYLSHNYPERLQKVIVVLWNAAVIVGALGFLLAMNRWMIWVALLLLVAAVWVYAIHLTQIKKHRHKRNPGNGIKWSMYATQALAVIATVLLLASLALFDSLLEAKTVVLAGWIYLGGWVSFTILSYASKIVPFLWWTHKYGQRIGKPGTPVMSDLLNEQKVFIGLAAIAVSTLLLLTGILLEMKGLIAIGGVAYSLFSIAYIALIGLVFSK